MDELGSVADRDLIDIFIEHGEDLMDGEKQAFSSMKVRLEEDDGLDLTDPQRMWAEEVCERIHRRGSKTMKRTLGKAALGTMEGKPVRDFWWDGSNPEFHPLRPPPGPRHGNTR